MALMQILVLGSSFVVENETGLWSENWERFRVPVPAMAITITTLELRDEVNCVRILCFFFLSKVLLFWGNC
jgi:hypothetical protein